MILHFTSIPPESGKAALRAEDAPRLGADTAPASLEDIMVHLEKEEDGGL